MNNKEISIPIKLDYADKTIEQLEKIKQLIKDIKELDNNFSLNNVIEANSRTILVFNSDYIFEKKDLQEAERILSGKLECKCIILNAGTKLSTSIQKNKEVDYQTTIFYSDGEIYKEETIQYK